VEAKLRPAAAPRPKKKNSDQIAIKLLKKKIKKTIPLLLALSYASLLDGKKKHKGALG